MGNHLSRGRSAGKVILSDGTIHKLDQPSSVAELMLDHPEEFVVELVPPGGGRVPPSKPTPLPADHELDPARVYLMIPMRQAKKAASVVARTMAAMEEGAAARAVLPKRWKHLQAPLRDMMMMMCCMGRSVRQMVITYDNPVAADVLAKEGVGEKEENRPELLSRQFSGKRWKPGLEPIEEKSTVQRRWWFRPIGSSKEG